MATTTGTTTDDGRYIETTDGGSTIVWQNVPRSETGGKLVGDIPETLLPVILDRLRALNRAPETASRETALAITKVQEAIHWLNDRRDDREARGVAGTRAD